jgi:hypothetical protein
MRPIEDGLLGMAFEIAELETAVPWAMAVAPIGLRLGIGLDYASFIETVEIYGPSRGEMLFMIFKRPTGGVMVADMADYSDTSFNDIETALTTIWHACLATE